jgi:hypothetical protein
VEQLDEGMGDGGAIASRVELMRQRVEWLGVLSEETNVEYILWLFQV